MSADVLQVDKSKVRAEMITMPTIVTTMTTDAQRHTTGYCYVKIDPRSDHEIRVAKARAAGLVREEYELLCKSIRDRDPHAALITPCKFAPRCSPPPGVTCRFSHVSPTTRAEFFRLQELVQLEDAEIRQAVQTHGERFREVHTELLFSPISYQECLVVTYAFRNHGYGTEYVYAPRGLFACRDVTEGYAAYAVHLEIMYPGLHVINVRVVWADRVMSADGVVCKETAGNGHPIREKFDFVLF